MKYERIKPALLMVGGMLLAIRAMAGGDPSDGHTHADEPPPAPVQASAPRAESATPDFEVVSVLENGRLTLYVNDFATNTPITKAQVEVEMGGTSSQSKENAPGIYSLALPALSTPGKHALTVSVTEGERSDLLLLTLETLPAAPVQAGRASFAWPWLAGAGGLIAVWLGIRILQRRRQMAGAALLVGVVMVMATVPQPASAHEGHDHAEEPSVPLEAGSRPHRLPGGGVFMPKASQYQLGIRTLLTEPASWARSLELAGHVQADPAASALVQASQSGRIEAGPRGLPYVGMKVRRGEVLAWLVPVANSLERGSLAAARAELGAALAQSEKRLARLQELEGSVPRKEIESAELEVEGLRQRKNALAGSLERREALVAPVSGEIAEVKISIGQVLESRDVAFSIVNRERLIIEALAYDVQAGGIREASAATLEGTTVAVVFLGAGAQLKEHALPVQFRVKEAKGLVVGQPVKVFVKLASAVTGVKLPRTALVRGPTGENAVWLQGRAEVFTLQPVTIDPLDAGHVVVRGVADGVRVVVQGTSLLNQVR